MFVFFVIFLNRVDIVVWISELLDDFLVVEFDKIDWGICFVFSMADCWIFLELFIWFCIDVFVKLGFLLSDFLEFCFCYLRFINICISRKIRIEFYVENVKKVGGRN